ncbi:MAG TPA: hypothetical protein VGI65_13470 [Steroidobacteraceae bacterium]
MIPAAALIVALLAQDESVGDNLAAGAILVKGAWASASDSVTPLPERGRQKGSDYSNDYFGFSYGVARGWIERFEGPPPSDGGYYVLAQLAPASPSRSAPGAHLLIAAQDLFFSLSDANNALELLNNVKDHLDDGYQVERAPKAVRIANHAFVRFDYASPESGLHWHVLAMDIRCHVVQFVFTGRSEPLMAHLIHDMNGMRLLTGEGTSPVCIKDYAASEYLIEREEPIYREPRFNSVPVRVIVDTQGRIRHMHFLNAYPDQAKSIADALGRWRFKPYLLNGQPTEVETGILFGRSTARTAQVFR